MRLDDYVMTERDKCRLVATLSTPEGRERLEKSLDEAYKTLHWRIQNEGFVPSPETMKSYEEWLAKHPELYTNPHPQK